MRQTGRNSASSISNNSQSNTSNISDCLLDSGSLQLGPYSNYYGNNLLQQPQQHQNIAAALLNFPNFPQQQLSHQQQINSFFDYSSAISETEIANYCFPEPSQQQQNLHSRVGLVPTTTQTTTPMLTNSTTNLHHITPAQQRQASSSASSSESSTISSTGTIPIEEKSTQIEMTQQQQQRIKSSTSPVSKLHPLHSLEQMQIKIEKPLRETNDSLPSSTTAYYLQGGSSSNMDPTKLSMYQLNNAAAAFQQYNLQYCHTFGAGQPNPAFAAWPSPHWPFSHQTSKKGRMTYRRDQTNHLEIKFQQTTYVTKKQREELRGNTGLSDRQIKIWFQNRRMKAKKEKNRTEDPNAEHQHSTLIPANPPSKSLNGRSSNEDRVGSSPPILGGQVGHSGFSHLGLDGTRGEDGSAGIGVMINGLINQPNTSNLNTGVMDEQEKLKVLLPSTHSTHCSTAPDMAAAMWSSMGNMQTSSMMMDQNFPSWYPINMIPQAHPINSATNANINSNPYYNLYPSNV